MAGEVLTGAMQGVGEITRTPITAAAVTVGTAVSAMPVSSAISEATVGVKKGLEAARNVALPSLGMAENVSAVGLGKRLSTNLERGDYHGALTDLAFGAPSDQLLDKTPYVPEAIISQDIRYMGSQKVAEIVDSVDRLRLSKDIINDPQFLKVFTKEAEGDLSALKKLFQEGGLAHDEYMAQRESVIVKSAEKARKGEGQVFVENEDLEELKRRAAMDAIRQHMALWRESVTKDKRLSSEAKHTALIRIDRFEQRLLTKEAIQWDGASLIKLIALAVSSV